jgi:hypothetical protein
VKTVTVPTLPRTVYHQSPSRKDKTRSVLCNLGDSALSIRPRPGLDPTPTLDTVQRQGRDGRCGTTLWVISPSHLPRRHGVQGWPAIPRARRYSQLNRNRQTITSRLPIVSASSRPIKGQARMEDKKRNTRQQARHKIETDIPGNHHCSLFPLFET